MSEKVLGVIWVMRYRFPRWVLEVLAITPHEVIVARPKGGKGVALAQAVGGIVGATVALAKDKKEKKKEQPTLDELLETDKKSFSIPNSEITKVELKKAFAGLKLNIIGKRKFKGYAKGVDLSRRPTSTSTAPEANLEDFENILRPAFGDKLSVKK